MSYALFHFLSVIYVCVHVLTSHFTITNTVRIELLFLIFNDV